MAQSTAVETARHPMDEALDLYSQGAELSGDPELIEDAARQHLIRGHRNFDRLVRLIRRNALRVYPQRHTVHVDKLALTDSLPVSAIDPQRNHKATHAERLASSMADDLHLPHDQWTDRILTLASEYAAQG